MDVHVEGGQGHLWWSNADLAATKEQKVAYTLHNRGRKYWNTTRPQNMYR